MWYVVINGEKRGPFSTEVIASKIKLNQISADFLVWTKGMSSWTPLKETVLIDILTEIPPALPCPHYVSEMQATEKVKNKQFDPKKDELYGLWGLLAVPAILSPLFLTSFIYQCLIIDGCDIRNPIVWEFFPVFNSLNTISVLWDSMGGIYLLYLFYSKNKKYPFHWLIIFILGNILELFIIICILLLYQRLENVAVLHLKMLCYDMLVLIVWCAYFVKSKRVYVTFFKKDYRERTKFGISSLWSLLDEENIKKSTAIDIGSSNKNESSEFYGEINEGKNDFLIENDNRVENESKSQQLCELPNAVIPQNEKKATKIKSTDNISFDEIWKSLDFDTRKIINDIFGKYSNIISPRNKIIFSKNFKLSTLEWGEDHSNILSLVILYYINRIGISRLSFLNQTERRIKILLKKDLFPENVFFPQDIENLLFEALAVNN